MKQRIVLADKNRLFREAVGFVLRSSGRFYLAAGVGDGPSLLNAVQKEKPEIVIVEALLPGINVIDAVKKIRTLDSLPAILGIGYAIDITLMAKMLFIGAAGIADKKGALSDLMFAIEEVSVNRRYIGPTISDALTQFYHSDEFLHAMHCPISLTPAERRILQLIAEGENVKEIASKVSCSHKTVEIHRMHIKHKLNIHTDVELVKYAIRQGLACV